jgi:G3E family GTPase
MTPSSAALPVTLLTGFLGSGKTTVLNHLLRQPGLGSTAVIINELGEIGIDHDLVETATEDFVLLKSGCVCCSVRSDLIDTLRDLFLRQMRGKIEFDRVVIETTGLADPAPVLHTLTGDPLVTARYRLDGVIATVDAVNGDDTLNRAFEAVKQAAVADRILLTKTDLAGAEAVGRRMARLRVLNPAAPIIPVVNGAVDPAGLFDIGLYNPATKSLDVRRWLNEEAFAPHHDHDHDDGLSRHDDSIRSFVFTLDRPIASTALARWLEMLVAVQGPDLLRVKGLVNVADRPNPLVIQGVQHIFHPPVELPAWPSEDRRTRIVFITRGLDERAARNTLSLFDH